MTSDERGLLDAIRDDPGDDAPRLVYADWLDDHARADHAELIRVQIAVARGDKSQALRQREADLIATLRRDWPDALAKATVHYRRGMGKAEWDWGRFKDGPRHLRKAGPPVWVVECELGLWTFADFPKMVGSPDFALLTRLFCGDRKPNGEVPKAVAASPHAVNLRDLCLKHSELDEEGAASLAESPWLVRLRQLSFSGTKVGAGVIARVVAPGTFPLLWDLDLAGCAHDEASMRALRRAEGLPNLRILNLTGDRIGDARLRLLLDSPLIGRLDELSLAANLFTDRGAKELAACAALKGLKRLNLNSNRITEEGARALLESPNLTGLEWIDLQSMPKITEETRKQLHRRYGRRQL